MTEPTLAHLAHTAEFMGGCLRLAFTSPDQSLFVAYAAPGRASDCLWLAAAKIDDVRLFDNATTISRLEQA